MTVDDHSSAGSVKCPPVRVDATVVPEATEQPWADPPVVVRLRATYRCARCHKHCLIPCTLTAEEFRDLARVAPDGGEVAGPVPTE